MVRGAPNVAGIPGDSKRREDLREVETLAIFGEVIQAAFAGTIGYAVISALAGTPRPLRLIDIAIECKKGKRSTLPGGEVRRVVERLIRAGVVVRTGGPGRPRYALDRRSRPAEVWLRMNRIVRLAQAMRGLDDY